jgi:hypothetical protein
VHVREQRAHARPREPNQQKERGEHREQRAA